MTDQQSDQPEAEFIDLDAVSLVVETTLYVYGSDEQDEYCVTAGAEPFILLSLRQKEGENTLAYEFVGSFVDTETDLLESLESFVEALRAKIDADTDSEAEDQLDAAINEHLDEELTRANEDAEIRDMGGYRA